MRWRGRQTDKAVRGDGGGTGVGEASCKLERDEKEVDGVRHADGDEVDAFLHCLSVYPSACLTACFSFYLCAFQYISARPLMSVCLSAFSLTLHMSADLSLYDCMPISQFICLHVGLSVCL